MADTVVNFTITNCLAFVSPLVVPFGLFYTVMKHLIDSYTLLSGIYKVSYLNTRFYMEVCNLMSLSTLLAQAITIISLFLSPVTAYLKFGAATTVGIALAFLSCVIVNQQVQSDHSWPLRLLPDVAEEPAEVADEEEEPLYEPPILEWLREHHF